MVTAQSAPCRLEQARGRLVAGSGDLSDNEAQRLGAQFVVGDLARPGDGFATVVRERGAVHSHAQPLGPAVAGRDQVFHNATAEIVDGTIRLTCPTVKRIVAIRYAWADNPDANLQNKEGLPALPFRTDKFPLTTAGKH